MTTSTRPPHPPSTSEPDRADPAGQSLGELVASASRDLSTLFRQELALAKTEITRDVTAAGKGAGLLGAAGVAALFGVALLSVAAAFGVAALGVSLGIGFLIVSAGYLLVGTALGLVGRRRLSAIHPPRQTVATVKDDVAWARHPTRTV